MRSKITSLSRFTKTRGVRETTRNKTIIVRGAPHFIATKIRGKSMMLAFILLASPAFAVEDSEDTMNIESVTILAESSLTVPVTEIAKIYSRHANVDVNTVYENTSELVNKIEEGDPADIIITPSKKFFDQMREEGLLDNQTITVIAGNNLDVVASKEMAVEKAADIRKVLELLHNKTLIIIGDTLTTELGQSTREALQKLKLWQSFDKFAVRAPTSAKVIDLIIKGQSAGVVYSTDAALYNDKINNLGHIPANLHEPINYYAAVVVSDNMDRAREAVKFLNTKPAKEIFKSSGFVVK